MPVKRQRTQPITRVRTGCFTCRRRKKRCGEEKPVCSGCMRNKLSCEWPSDLSPRRAYRPESHHGDRSSSVENVGDSPSPSLDGLTNHGGNDGWLKPAAPELPTSPVLSITSVENTNQETPSPENAVEAYPAWMPNVGEATGQELGLQRITIPRGTSLLPGYDAESYQLLNHYLSSTADCMANGSNPINPFLVQIVPLAFSSDLLLQLVLTQSAAHRAFRCHNDADAVAHGQYTKALQRFRKGISDFIGEAETTPLMLAVGALLMCFTEVSANLNIVESCLISRRPKAILMGPSLITSLRQIHCCSVWYRNPTPRSQENWRISSSNTTHIPRQSA